jgi:hypothetical protein
MKRKLKKEKKKASVINRANFICQARSKAEFISGLTDKVSAWYDKLSFFFGFT